MKKMLFGLMTAIATFTGCESKQPAGELPRIDLTATSFAFDQVEIADEIESIEYVPLELTDESLIADVLDLCVSDEYIFVYSTRQDGVLQFDRKGKYLRCIAKTGNGPGETGQIISLTVDAVSYTHLTLPTRTASSVSANTSPPLSTPLMENLSKR